MEKWSYIGDVLWGPAAHSPLVTRAICSRGAPYVGFMDPSVVAELTTVGAVLCGAVPWPSWLPDPTSAVAVGLLVGRIGFQCD